MATRVKPLASALRPTFFNAPTVNLQPGQTQDITTINGPAILKWAYFISAGDQGQAGFALRNNDTMGPSPLFPTPTGFGPNPGTVWIFPALWVQFLQHPELGFVTTGLPVSSSFTASTRYMAGAFNTDTSGNVNTQELAISTSIYISGQVVVSVANFNKSIPSSIAIQVWAEVASMTQPNLIFAPGYSPVGEG